MPLQNRVLPTGEIVADPARGLIMGNRGCLHGQGRAGSRELGVTRWRSSLWLCCVMDFRGRQRDVMPPGRWTALFFLDEASALSAGHRPCAHCRRPDYVAFAQAWRAARDLPRRPLAKEMDAALHAERTNRHRAKLTYRARLADLPDGTMVREGEEISLCLAGDLLPWSWTGYGPPRPARAAGAVEVLTPPSIVAALAAGYRPMLHPTAVRQTAPSAVRLR